MRYFFFLLGLVCLASCQEDQTSSNTNEPTEKVAASSQDSTKAIPNGNLEAQFKKIIVNPEGEALKFVSNASSTHWVVFYPDGRFDADGDVPLQGKWRFNNNQLELYYNQRDQWYPVPFEIYEDGSFKLHRKHHMFPQ